MIEGEGLYGKFAVGPNFGRSQKKRNLGIVFPAAGVAFPNSEVEAVIQE